MEGQQSAHVVVLAYHGQGHINPIVQFSKRLASQGIKVTVTTTLSNTQKMKSTSDLITFVHIYDDQSDGAEHGVGGFKGFLDRFEATGSKNLTELVKKHENSEFPVKFLIYDANIPWASSIAEEMGLIKAAFFTQSCAAIAGYYPMHVEVSGEKSPVPAFSMPRLPQPRLPNVASLGPASGGFSPIILHILRQFDNVKNAKWVIFNSFTELEQDVVEWMSNLWPVMTIGPCVPSVYLDKRIQNDNSYGFNLFNPSTNTVMEFLDTKTPNSVVYVSVGSVTNLTTEQMEEMSIALKQYNGYFLWVVRPTEMSKIPDDFVEKTSEKGLVVSWCSQLEVLGHDAIGCFVSHCGWNSSIEAISFGVPVIAMPQFLDQMTNAHFLEKVWGVAILAQADEKGVTKSEELGRCLEEMMHGDRGQVIKKKASYWKEMAKDAIGQGGSSDKCIQEIVKSILAA